ncbi:hypothetical protein JW859_07085 [bacterium]|nr:hypothetical protein [bacterium]
MRNMKAGLCAKNMIIVPLAVAVCAVYVLVAAPALAASTQVVTELPGRADVVKTAPYSHWLAAWAEGTDGSYTLWVVDTNNGRKQEVTTSAYPGGYCWIPKYNKLFYCKGQYVSEMELYRVVYYSFDPTTAESTKIIELRDFMETFKLDPLAADDGSIVFHRTVDQGTTTFGEGTIPSFNYYDPVENKMDALPANANIGSDYDMASDGLEIFWPLYKEDTGDLYFVGWSTERNEEVWNAMYFEYVNPADAGGMIRVDAANQRIAMLAQSSSQPRMQMCVYGWQGQELLAPIPVFLEAGEEILHFDWRGITGKVYAVVYKEQAAAGGKLTHNFSLEVIDPMLGIREVLVSGTDAFGYADYDAGTGRYYYCVISEQSRDPKTYLIRVDP